MKKALLSLMIASFSSGLMADTCSISVSGGGGDDRFGDFFRIKIKTDVKAPDRIKQPNIIVFSDIRADPKLGNVTIARRKGKLAYSGWRVIGKANKVMYFKFVSDSDLDMLPVGTYQASATIEAHCGNAY